MDLVYRCMSWFWNHKDKDLGITEKVHPSHMWNLPEKKSVLFDEWISFCKANDFRFFKELLLLEEFKRCVPNRVVTYLNEQKSASITKAAVMAEEFMLTLKPTFTSTGPLENSSFKNESKV